jgi:hypothetical protein
LARFSLKLRPMTVQHTHWSPTATTLPTLTDGRAVVERALLQEVCPLCLARYAAVDECICVACEAPSCPDCAEQMPGTESMLCYACPVPTKH